MASRQQQKKLLLDEAKCCSKCNEVTTYVEEFDDSNYGPKEIHIMTCPLV